jgi:hypothetical protein
VKEEETFQQQAPVGVEVQLSVYQRALLFVFVYTRELFIFFACVERCFFFFSPAKQELVHVYTRELRFSSSPWRTQAGKTLCGKSFLVYTGKTRGALWYIVYQRALRGGVREEEYCICMGGEECRVCVGEGGGGAEVRFDVYKRGSA